MAENSFHPSRVFRLGTVPYAEAFQLQTRLAQARAEGEVEDTLLLLQHPPVITIGRSGKEKNILVPPALLREKEIELVYTDRGGDVTYHGPGQLVAYAIFSLRLHGLSVPDYVWKLEEVVIRVLSRFGIPAGRVERLRGVWTGREKICSLGVHLSRWISKHGLALNVNTDLDPFRLINPCGMTDRKITSMAKILGRTLPLEEMENLTVRAFREVFRSSLVEHPPALLERYW